ncbi:MAG: S-layer homology domain-containing protein [Tindallia sp. MSAO_Bac2]|nr:MAG: S-layer homology domain-containing protein [Tindallia sp. MSAO_Bac2]
MSISKRDKVLLLVFVFILLFYGSYRVIVVDQLAIINQRKAELTNIRNQKDLMNELVNNKEQIDVDLRAINAEVSKLKRSHFSLIQEQEEIILLMNEFMANPDLRPNIAFTQPSNETISNSEISSMYITLNYESTYTDLLNLLRTFWQFDRKILINQLSVSAASENHLSGSFELAIYDLSPITGDRDRLFMWFENIENFKTNPYAFANPQLPDHERYAFIDPETALQIEKPYKPFQDVSGHWAESAIHNLGERRVFLPTGSLNFEPDEYVTRGLFIIWMDRFFQWPVPDEPVDLTGFDDHDTLGRYEGSVSRAVFSGYQSGLIVGHEDNTLRPLDPITYEETELAMRRILDNEDFTWNEYAEIILDLTDYSSPGIEDITLPMTRAEAAYFLYLIAEENNR